MKDTKDPGLIYVPYVIKEHTEESLKKHKEFMDEYHRKHKYCPNCFGEGYETTLMGYILDWDNKENYKDLNTCKCSQCGHIHTTHDRIEIKII